MRIKRLLITALIASLLCGLLPAAAFAWDNAAAKSLLNAADLTPLATGYTPLDQKVADIFASLFDASTTTYEKVKLCYDYVITGASYRAVNPSAALYNDVDGACGYDQTDDTYITARAYRFLTTKTGTCLDFADTFLVLMRAIGLECYVMRGTYDSGTHYWNLIRLGGSYYIFDTQADWTASGRNGTSTAHYSFCLSESSDSHRKCDRAACIAAFGCFRCKNKTNEPGATVPGTAAPSADAQTGTEPTAAENEPDVYATGSAVSLQKPPGKTARGGQKIPAGTRLSVTEVSDGWGKTEYRGKTGWIPLDACTLLSGDAEPAILPGDADGNGRLTAEDARRILRAAVGLDVYAAGSREALACDANADGQITSGDARLILRAVVGLEN